MQELLEEARAIYARHAAGCCLHVVLDDGNVENESLDVCAERARDEAHVDCAGLVEKLRGVPEDERWWLHEQVLGEPKTAEAKSATLLRVLPLGSLSFDDQGNLWLHATWRDTRGGTDD